MMVIAVAVGLCVGCEGLKKSPPPTPPTNGETEAKVPDVSGEWLVTWETVPSGGPALQDFTLTLEQDNGDLEGKADDDALTWDVEGEVEEDGDIDFTMEVPGTTIKFEGEVVSATKMEGTFEVLGGDSGTFEAFKTK